MLALYERLLVRNLLVSVVCHVCAYDPLCVRVATLYTVVFHVCVYCLLSVRADILRASVHCRVCSARDEVFLRACVSVLMFVPVRFCVPVSLCVFVLVHAYSHTDCDTVCACAIEHIYCHTGCFTYFPSVTEAVFNVLGYPPTRTSPTTITANHHQRWSLDHEFSATVDTPSRQLPTW